MIATVLFVDDEPNVLQGLRRSLRSMRKEWNMYFAEGAHAGLEVLKETQVDIVVSDMRMPEMDGAAFLEEVSREYPTTARFVLSGQADRETTYRATGPSHQFFSKPFDANLLVATLSRVAALRRRLSEGAIRAVSGLRCVPSTATSRQRLAAIISGNEPNIDDVTNAICSDIGLKLKTLQLTNSTYFGTGPKVYCAEDAARMLDVSVLSELVDQGRFSVPLVFKQNELAYQELTDTALRRGEQSAALAKAEGMSTDQQALARAGGYFSAIPELLLLTEYGDMIESSDQAAGVYLLALWGIPPALIDVLDQETEPDEVIGAVRTVIDRAKVLADEKAMVGSNTNTSQIVQAVG